MESFLRQISFGTNVYLIYNFQCIFMQDAHISAARFSCSAMSFGFRMSGRLCEDRAQNGHIKYVLSNNQFRLYYQKCPDDSQLPAPLDFSLEVIERQFLHLAPDVILRGENKCEVITMFHRVKKIYIVFRRLFV